MEQKICIDLICHNEETGIDTLISCFDAMHYDEERSDLIIHSYGYIYYLHHPEKFTFKTVFRVINHAGLADYDFIKKGEKKDG